MKKPRCAHQPPQATKHARARKRVGAIVWNSHACKLFRFTEGVPKLLPEKCVVGNERERVFSRTRCPARGQAEGREGRLKLARWRWKALWVGCRSPRVAPGRSKYRPSYERGGKRHQDSRTFFVGLRHKPNGTVLGVWLLVWPFDRHMPHTQADHPLPPYK